MVVSIKKNLLEILLLFFIILATGTDNEQPNLRLLQGYWTFYKTNVMGSQTKGVAAIWNDKVWAIHTHEGINQAQSLDLGLLRYLERTRTELVWQIVINENDFEVVIINGKECAIWTPKESNKFREAPKPAKDLKNVKKDKEAPEQAKDLEKPDLTLEIGDKFLVHEKFSMFNENVWLQNGDIIEVQDLLPDGDFIFKTNDRFNLVGDLTEFRKNEKQMILKQLPKTWKYEFVSERYKQGAMLLDIHSPKINDIFEVKQIDQEGKLCLFKYSVTKPPETGNVDQKFHKMSQISQLMTRFMDKNIKKFFLNSKTMERFYPLPFSPKNMMSKFIDHAPEALGKHFLPFLTDYDLFLLSICFGVFPEYLSKFHNSKQYKSLCISHCQKTFPNLSNSIFSINLETSYKLKASNFPFRKFKLVLQSKNLRSSFISCWFLTYSQKNESYIYAGHTENGLYPGEALEFNLHGISWPESNGRRGNLIFPEDDGEVFMRIEPYMIGENIFFKLETFYDFQF